MNSERDNLLFTSPPFQGGEGGGSDSFFFRQFGKKHGPDRTLVFGMITVGVVFIVISLSLFYWRTPKQFPGGSYFTVGEGMALSEAAQLLEERALIRSAFWFTAFGILWGGERGLKAGEYYFKEPISVSRVAWRLTHGIYELVPVRVLIPEGFNNAQISALLKKLLPSFNEKLFLKEARDKEGFLFPDTYLFLPNAKETQIIEAMGNVFEEKMAGIQGELNRFGRQLSDVIIMASLLEEEARTAETRQKIAGILWKRLDAGMPLQVDAVFPYIFGDKPYDLTDGDLLVDSPYNTYKYVGLPPGPITNPGLNAIRAAVTPIGTPYWYYLSDKEGNMHYARTHEEHLQNRKKYLGL